MRKTLLGALLAALVLSAAGAVLYALNPAPAVPTITSGEAAAAGQPWVVKLHAQWCPVCMLTKGVWAKIEQAYRGEVRFAIFDFTDAATTAATRTEAARLGLTQLFDEAAFATGPIVVLDGETKEVRAWINGSRELADYRAAIDAALAANR